MEEGKHLEVRTFQEGKHLEVQTFREGKVHLVGQTWEDGKVHHLVVRTLEEDKVQDHLGC